METVFVVDGNADIRRALGELLEDEGLRPLLFETSDAARRAFAASRPSLVVVEPYVPPISGRMRPRSLPVVTPRFAAPVIVFTAWDRRLIFADAEIPMVAKPDVRTLIALIHAELGRRSLSQASDRLRSVG